MKLNYLFIAALLIVSSVASAKDEPRRTGMAIVPVKGSEVYKLIYKGETTGRIKFNIYNADAKIILSQTVIGVDGFICPINFKGLEAGEYTIEVVDGTGKRSEKIIYAPKKDINKIHVSKLVNNSGKFLLSVSNEGNKQIFVNIFDSKNNLIHSERKNISGDFAQVYKLNSGSYTFEVSDNKGNSRTIRF